MPNPQFLNPLDIPYILELVFQQLSPFHLKKCRLVCSAWEKEATNILFTRSKITFNSSQQISTFLKEFGESNQFGEKHRQICQTCDLSHSLDIEDSKVLELFRGIGHSIKSLDLSYHTKIDFTWAEKSFHNLSSLEELCLNGRSRFLQDESDEIVGEWTFTLPNLKFLFIYDSSYEPANETWIQRAYYILASAPRLERVFFAPFSESRAQSFFSLLTSQKNLNLTHLHINHFAPLGHDLQSLSIFPLRYVHLVITNALRREALDSFLQRVQVTLRELTLTFTNDVGTAQFHPLELNSLTKLSLVGHEGPLVTSSAENLQLFVTSLPENGRNIRLKLNPSLAELEIYDCKAKYCEEVVSPLFKYFFNLSVLKINNVDDNILRIIYSHLSGTLKELRVVFHKFFGVTSLPIDVGLCGIPEFRLDGDLLHSVNPCEDLAHLRSYPWIGKMKKLTILELELGSLSDYGVILGIAAGCENLQRLVLKRSVIPEVEEMTINEVGEDNEITDLSLQSLCDLRKLTYLKLEGYLDCFSQEAVQMLQSNTAGKEFYVL